MTAVRKNTYDAVVVRPGVSWFASQARARQHRVTPDWARHDITQLVETAGKYWFGDEGTILHQCGEPALLREHIAGLREGGWNVTDAGFDTGWFSLYRPGTSTVHLGIGPLIKSSRFTIAKLSDPADVVAQSMADYSRLTGIAWRGTAGMCGIEGIRRTHSKPGKGNQPLWIWDDAARAQVSGTAFELVPHRHSRPLSADEEAARYVHVFDVRAMYLAAASTCEVGWDVPTPQGAAEFDPSRAGYWLVRADQLADADPEVVQMPSDDDPFGGNVTWLSTPVMAYLYETGRRPEVLDTYLCERTGRYLREWAESLRDARAAAEDSPALRGIKDTYVRAVGMLRRPGGRIYRPDWRDMLVDRARVNMVRKVRRSGYDPLRWKTDAIWFATDDDAATAARKLGVTYDAIGHEVPRIGAFTHVDTMTPGAYVGTYERQEAA